MVILEQNIDAAVPAIRDFAPLARIAGQLGDPACRDRLGDDFVRMAGIDANQMPIDAD